MASSKIAVSTVYLATTFAKPPFLTYVPQGSISYAADLIPKTDMQALQPFRLMDLPPEIQLKILTEAVEPWYIEIRYRREDLDDPHYETKVYATSAFPPLLLVSRYFHNAVGPIIPTRFTGILDIPQGIIC